MNQMTTYRWSLLEDVTHYREAGIGAIGLWRPKLIEFGEERGIDLVGESGLAVSSLSWAGGFTGSGGHSFEEAVDDAREALRTAGELRADCLVIVSGARAGHTANHARRLLVQALCSLADTAAEFNVPLALQPMHPIFSREWTFLTALDEAVEVLDRCDHEYVRLAFDAYHMWQEPRLTERIAEIAPRTAVVQLSDWRDPPRSENDRHLPGDGCIPLPKIVAAFEDADFDGFYELEIWSEEVWNSDYHQVLAGCIDRYENLWRG